MEEAPCLSCGRYFIPRNRRQKYCVRSECQRARKAAWEKNKLQTSSDYAADRRLSRKKWQKNNPGYWKNYRVKNPEKADRNRALQRIRNRRRSSAEPVAIAKTDVGKTASIKLYGAFWLVPMIANTDVRKIFLRELTDTSP